MATTDTFVPPQTPHHHSNHDSNPDSNPEEVNKSNTHLFNNTNSHQHANALPSSSPAFATPLHPIRPVPLGQKTTTTTTLQRESSPALPPQESTPHHAPTPPPPVLPTSIPPATLRPIAFRTFTKKHNLTLTSSSLSLLATFIGKHCGSKWRSDGLAELVLEEIAKTWKRVESGKVIVETKDEKGDVLREILRGLEGAMTGGRIVEGKRRGLSREGSLSGTLSREGSFTAGLNRQGSFGMSGLSVERDGKEDMDEEEGRDPRAWLRVVGAFDQPRLIYNAERKHFEKAKNKSTLLPTTTSRTTLFRQRYNLLHQRLHRTSAFQTPILTTSRTKPTSRNPHTQHQQQQQYKVTSITNLLGRSGTPHLLLGMLITTPTGTLAICDLTGSIHLDLSQATLIDEVESWIFPGCIVLVDGVYEENYNPDGGVLGTRGGIGGMVGGRFVGFSVGAPRAETRGMTLGIGDVENGGNGSDDGLHIGGGFGWVDFLGLGSEKAVGARMRRIERKMLTRRTEERINSNKIVVLGEVNLDNPSTLAALRAVLIKYSTAKTAHSQTYPANEASNDNTTAPKEREEPLPPMAFILLGNFISHAAMSNTTSTTTSNTGSSNGSSKIPDSITYKEVFDTLATLLSDFPTLLRNSTWIFIPGDNDPWASSFSAGAAVPLPRKEVPELFTSRIRRVFATANQAIEGERRKDDVKGEAVWTSNPTRLGLFGGCCEIVGFRDDVCGRMSRSSIPLGYNGDDEVGENGIEDEAIGAARTVTDASGQDAEMADIEQPSRGATTDKIPDDPDIMEVESTMPNSKEEKNKKKKEAQRPIMTPAHRLTKTLLDQSYLSPFPMNLRPQHWDYASSSLSLYPLPTTLMLCDPEAEAFVLTYQGCVVMNTGSITGERVGVKNDGISRRGRGGGKACWCEFDVSERRAEVKSLLL